MALVGPGAMTEYTGGPRQSRSRGFVTVDQPANGFFIAGSSIDAMNGVYGRVRTESVWASRTRAIGLAYRQDQTNWLMCMVEKQADPCAPKKEKKQQRRGRHHDTSSESSSEEEEADDEWEWVFIDLDSRDRFMHKGDTIIPAAGTQWKHVHRGRMVPEKDNQDDSDSDGAEATQARSSTEALVKQDADDEDELPWQVIAILDQQTMRDLRYTKQHYDANIRNALSGKKLPQPEMLSLKDSVPGCWMYQVVASLVEVHSRPSNNAPIKARRQRKEILQVIEKQGGWLRLREPNDGGWGHNARNREFSFDSEDSNSDQEEILTRVRATGPAPGWWVALYDDDGLERLHLMDAPNCDADVPDMPDADIFDRPFEPRLQDPNMPEEVGKELDSEEEFEDCISGVTSVALTVPVLPDEVAVGAQVVLEGLSNAEFNGQRAVVTTKKQESGRQGVRLELSGKKISVKSPNLRPFSEGETGPLARHARVLGLTLACLGLNEADEAEGLKKKEEGESEEKGKEIKKETEKQQQEAQTDRRLREKELLGAALRAVQRDLPDDATSAHKDADIAHDKLMEALEARPGDDPSTESSSAPMAPKAPHEVLESGALGSRAAAAARKSSSPDSLAEIEEGVAMLHEILVDEQSRLRQVLSPQQLAETPEGDDALRIRLSLVRGFLRCRRDTDAFREAVDAAKVHPTAAAALLWHARCLLRKGKRPEGLKVLESASNASHSTVDSLWAIAEASKRLHGIRQAERFQRKADDGYARGQFEQAVELYSQAVKCSEQVGDDKWGRAELLANRASCRRRARQFKEAVDDLDLSLSLFPRYKRAHCRRGVCLLEAGRPAEAVKSFEQLLALDRTWPNLLEWLVRSYAIQRRMDADGGQRRHYASDFSTPMDDGKWAQAPDASDLASAKDHYTVLGVPTDATEKQLKRAYRVMSLKYHPDKEGGSTRAFQRIATAYETLSDPEKRQRYDEGADLQKKGNNSDSESSDDEREKQSLREEVERKYYPERYKFWPFGDPFIQKRKIQARRRQREGQPAWHQADV